ncbi:MAG: hypothetical protein FJ288_17130 [Planctomycetes bacterium]|nr:hypothetical protein [Planctomycetota bacterium]
MNAVRLWVAEGGMTMAALGLVATVLAYLILERLLAIRSAGRLLESAGAPPGGAVLDAMALRGLRRMGFIRACIVAAPLLGLLGTVTGMDVPLYAAEASDVAPGIDTDLKLTMRYYTDPRLLDTAKAVQDLPDWMRGRAGKTGWSNETSEFPREFRHGSNKPHAPRGDGWCGPVIPRRCRGL